MIGAILRTQFETSQFPLLATMCVFIWLSSALALGIFIPRLLRPQPKAWKPQAGNRRSKLSSRYTSKEVIEGRGRGKEKGRDVDFQSLFPKF